MAIKIIKAVTDKSFPDKKKYEEIKQEEDIDSLEFVQLSRIERNLSGGWESFNYRVAEDRKKGLVYLKINDGFERTLAVLGGNKKDILSKLGEVHKNIDEWVEKHGMSYAIYHQEGNC